MNSELLLLFSFIVTISANIENELIFDYFYHKKAPSVVGFSCNNAQDDLSLARRFNKIGVATSFRKLDDEYPINRFAHSSYWKLGVFLDLRCASKDSIVSAFSEASDYRMYDELHYWLIFGSSTEDLFNIVDDRAFGLSTDFVFVVPAMDDQKGTFELYDVYNAWKERGAKLNVTYLGSWSVDGRLNITLNESKFNRRANLHGMILRTSFFYSKFKPHDMALEDYLQDYASTPRDGISKYGFNMIKHLSELFNFKLQCGLDLKWEGGDTIGPVIRSLYNKQTDITGTPATISAKRSDMVKYIHQSWTFRTCFIFRSPQPKNIKINEILGPLEMQVWYLTATFFAISVWVMAALFRYENIDSTFMRYSNSALLNVGALCQQGTDINMNRVSTRIAFYFIMLFSFLFFNYYSASVVSVRLNDPIYKLNDSLSELAKTNLKFSSEWLVYFDLFIKQQDWETKTFYAKRWLHIPEPEQFMEPDKAMRLVQQGVLAYHMHPDVGYPYVNRFYNNRETCELTEVHLAHPRLSAFAVSRNSTFVEMMRVGLTKISEIGLRHRQLHRWTARKPQCLTDVLSASGINIYECSPHLLILMIGMGFAAIICVFEQAWAGQSRRSRELMRTIWAGK